MQSPLQSSTIMRRRRFIRPSGLFSNLRILEFGPRDRPSFVGSDGYVRYLDWFSKSELMQMHPELAQKDPSAFGSPDYVVKSSCFSNSVNETFDLLVANHVLEHVPDMIGWLSEAAAISSQRCELFLSLPDRRFTFDYFRRCSDLVDVYRCHMERLEKPDFYQVLRNLYYHQKVDAGLIWQGEAPSPTRRFSFKLAVALAQEYSQTYSDTHCHVFTYQSFCTLMDDLHQAGLSRWRVVKSADVIDGHVEFHALLTLSSADAV